MLTKLYSDCDILVEYKCEQFVSLLVLFSSFASTFDLVMFCSCCVSECRGQFYALIAMTLEADAFQNKMDKKMNTPICIRLRDGDWRLECVI